MKTEFKSAEEWDKTLLASQNKILESTGWTEKTLHDATITNYRAVQSNTMREAARILTNLDTTQSSGYLKSQAVCWLHDAAISIEKGEYKPV